MVTQVTVNPIPHAEAERSEASGTPSKIENRPSKINLGPLQLDAPFYQAGLAGYSDEAMRRVARQHGCPYCVTEAMLDQFLIAGGKGLAAAELHDDDHPIAGQLMGSHPKEIAEGAKILVRLGYDTVDINLACPVKKIKKKARGGHLLKDHEEGIAILKAVKDAVGDDVPLTVKLRRGTDDSTEAAERFYAIFETAMAEGYAGSTVHGRTVDQKYLGPSHWPFLKDLVQRYNLNRKSQIENQKSIFLLGGSGDIWRATDIFRMLRETGVHWVSVARGCIGNPWIFEQARRYMQNPDDTAAITRGPTIFEQRDVLLNHFELSASLHGERRASIMMRKFGIKFSRHHPKGEEVRQAYIQASSAADWHAAVNHWYHTDGPGLDDVIPDEAKGCYASCEPVSQ